MSVKASVRTICGSRPEIFRTLAFADAPSQPPSTQSPGRRRDRPLQSGGHPCQRQLQPRALSAAAGRAWSRPGPFRSAPRPSAPPRRRLRALGIAASLGRRSLGTGRGRHRRSPWSLRHAESTGRSPVRPGGASSRTAAGQMISPAPGSTAEPLPKENRDRGHADGAEGGSGDGGPHRADAPTVTAKGPAMSTKGVRTKRNCGPQTPRRRRPERWGQVRWRVCRSARALRQTYLTLPHFRHGAGWPLATARRPRATSQDSTSAPP